MSKVSAKMFDNEYVSSIVRRSIRYMIKFATATVRMNSDAHPEGLWKAERRDHRAKSREAESRNDSQLLNIQTICRLCHILYSGAAGAQSG
jgi:hypothetical protein